MRLQPTKNDLSESVRSKAVVLEVRPAKASLAWPSTSISVKIL
jgi:hypothetical protein